MLMPKSLSQFISCLFNHAKGRRSPGALTGFLRSGFHYNILWFETLFKCAGGISQFLSNLVELGSFQQRICVPPGPPPPTDTES